LKEINVGQQAFFKALDAAIDRAPIEDWKTYMALASDELRPRLGSPKNSSAEDFDFRGKDADWREGNQPR